MSQNRKSRWRVTLVLLTALLLVSASRACWAEALPPSAARFIQFYHQSGAAPAAGLGQVGWWERLLFSLILASTTPTPEEPATSF